MAQGTIYGTTANKTIDSKIEWSSTSSTANNNSEVTASLWYRRNNTYSGTPTGGTGTVSVTIDGQSGSAKVSLTVPNDKSWVKAIEVTKPVSHISDGTRSITIRASGSLPPSSLSATYCSGTAVLDNIPRQANITSSVNFTDLDNPTVYYSNPAGNAVDSLMACISFTGAKDDIAYRNISKTGTYYTFMLTDAERNILRNNTTSGSRNVIFFVRTIIGGVTYWSTDTKLFTVVENDDTRPSVSMTVTLNNGSLPSKFDGQYIQGKSRLNVSLSAQGKYSADILNYSASVGGESYYAKSFLSNVLSREGKVDIIGYAKDSRKFIGTASKQVEVTAYSKPLVIPIGSETAIYCYRSDGNGKRIGNSTSVWIKAKRSYYSLSGKNQCALRWRSKLVTEAWNDSTHQWKDLIPKTNTASSEYNALLSGEVFDLKKSYSIQIMAIDDVGEYDIKSFELPTQDVALHLGKGGKNVSVGTYCDYSEDYTFHSDWKAIFDKGFIDGTDTGWKQINNYILYRYKCGYVTIVGISHGDIELTKGDYKVVGKIPNEYAPTTRVPIVFHTIGGSPVAQSGFVEAAGDVGDIRLYSNVGETSYWAFSVTYPI